MKTSILSMMILVAVTTLSSCSKKIISSTTTTERDSVGAHKTDTLKAVKVYPAVNSKPFYGNVYDFCDSILRGLIPLPYHWESDKPEFRVDTVMVHDTVKTIVKIPIRKNILTVDIDRGGTLYAACHEDAFRDTIVSLRDSLTIYKIKESSTTTQEVHWWENLFKYGFWVLLGLLLLTISMLVNKK